MTEVVYWLSSEFKIEENPYAMVIDQEGRIAAHGMLKEMLKTAHELAHKSKP